MGKAFSKLFQGSRLFKDTATSTDEAKGAWMVDGFPEVDGELLLNGLYEYVGEHHGFPSYRIVEGNTTLYVDHSDGQWALNAAPEDGRCVAYSAEGTWLREPPATGWLVSRRYMGGGRGFDPCGTVTIREISDRQTPIVDLRVVGFPCDTGLDGLYKSVGRVDRYHGDHYRRGEYSVLARDGVWGIHCGGLDDDCQVAFSLNRSAPYKPIPPSSGWVLGSVASEYTDVPAPLSRCIAFILKPRRPPPTGSPDATPACGLCGDPFPDSGALVTHRRAAHGAAEVVFPTDTLVLIFAYVPHCALGSAAAVSSTWYAAYTSDPFWTHAAPLVLPFFNWAESFCIAEADCETIGTDPKHFYATTRTAANDDDDDDDEADSSPYAKFQQVVSGRRTCLVQAFDKHLRDGFKMTAYDGFAFFRSPQLWNVYYVQPTVPRADESRCYFAAELVTADRVRRVCDSCVRYSPYDPHFPPGALPGHFPPSLDVEIQYRFREEDPYGWWKGVVGETHRRSDGTWEVVVHFPQYRDNPKWATESVILGQKNLKPIAFDKQQSVGGIRVVTPQEKNQWALRQTVWNF
eukprot:TRINITY_DN4780_c0_g1_i1.p1 TRINITY_DN4780_c0_g1~~TRINITY_DN4780_c0_g1_i1.p1  ORF type:complete len:582 (+),score=132.30 TRINITY_DN4780_c0_g1_i1:25-1746(+)